MAQSTPTKTTGIIAQYLSHPPTCNPYNFPTTRYKFSSFEENAEATILTTGDMFYFWNEYISPEEGKSIFASPLLASKELLSKLPKTRKLILNPSSGIGGILTSSLGIVASGQDPLFSEGIAYGQALEEAGVDVSVDEYPGLPHCFYLELDLPSTKTYFERVVGFVKEVAGEA